MQASSHREIVHVQTKFGGNESQAHGTRCSQGRDVHVAVQLIALWHHLQHNVAAVGSLAQAASYALHHCAAQRLLLPAAAGPHV